MKIKTINKVISKKFDDFLSSIQDQEVKTLIRKNTMISGGCIASMLLKEPVNDFDLYFTNKETVLAGANYYAKKLLEEHEDLDIHVIDTDQYDQMEKEKREYYQGRGFTQNGRVGIFCKNQKFDETEVDQDDFLDLMEEEAEARKTENSDDKPKYRVRFISPSAISLSHHVQIVLRFYGSPEEVHKNFDFVHCTNYWLSEGPALVLKQKALESLLTRELMYVGSKYPICSMIRIRKFTLRGWTCNAGNYLKIAHQISKLDLEHIPTLEDQLIGVDVAHFAAFIEALKRAQKAHQDEAKAFVLTYDYVCEIIDRIFND